MKLISHHSGIEGIILNIIYKFFARDSNILCLSNISRISPAAKPLCGSLWHFLSQREPERISVALSDSLFLFVVLSLWLTLALSLALWLDLSLSLWFSPSLSLSVSVKHVFLFNVAFLFQLCKTVKNGFCAEKIACIVFRADSAL